MMTRWEKLNAGQQRQVAKLMLDAAIAGDPDFVEAALDAGAPATMRTENGASLMHLMVWQEQLTPRLIRKLEAAGASLTDRTHFGETPLHWAASEGDLPMIWQLLKLGANPNLPDNRGDTPVHIAVTRGDAGIQRALVMAGGDLHLPNNDGKRPDDCLNSRDVRKETLRVLAELTQWETEQQHVPDAVMQAQTVPELLACYSGRPDTPPASMAAWKIFPARLKELCNAGGDITPEMVKATAQHGSGILEEASKAFVLPSVLAALNAQDVYITQDFLLDETRQLSKLGQVLVAGLDAQHLFTEDNWQGHAVRELRETMNALPESDHWQVNNSHQLVAALSRQQRSVGR